MGLLKKLFTNCACPQGRMGRAMLKFMNLCHAPLTNWGLKLFKTAGRCLTSDVAEEQPYNDC